MARRVGKCAPRLLPRYRHVAVASRDTDSNADGSRWDRSDFGGK